GTTYRIPPYEGSERGNTLIENSGNAVTLEVRWTYNRTLAEWQSVLESGESFLMTLNKKLMVNDHSTGFPQNAKLVLVDSNNKNKYYYAQEGDSGLYTSDSETGYKMLDLDKFKDEDGNKFKAIDFNDFFVVTVSDADENTRTKFSRLSAGITKSAAIEDGATVYDGTYYYKPDGDGSYEITLSYKTGVPDDDGNIMEDYYISFFLDEDDNTDLYHLEISDRGSFMEETYPTKVANNKTTHLVTGDIFVNNFEIVDVDSLTSEKKMTLALDGYNDTLTGVLKAHVGIKASQRATMASFLRRDSVEVYHSFLVMLNKQDQTGSERGIIERPVVTVSDYKITHTDSQTSEVVVDKVIDTVNEMTNIYDLLNSNYVELRSNENLKTYLRNSCVAATHNTIEIHATVSLSYPDETKLKGQFPTRDTEHINDETIGTLFGAASGLSASAEAASYNKTLKEDWDNVPYYCTINTNASLVLNSDDSTNVYGEYYQFGVNGMDLDRDNLTENGEVPMKVNAVYNTSSLLDALSARSMIVKLTVRKKSDYDVTLPVETYISDLKLFDSDKKDFADSSNAATITVDKSNPNEFVYKINYPMDNLVYDEESKVYQIPITYAVKTGAAFESEGLEYSNYMMKLEVEIFNNTAATEENKITGSFGTDHIIWTNARVVPSMLED
ncbi:MAG: hypothetical protein IKN54_05250, partial [Lachnospiraceae bacterium]|nr:hypothetical protein [Lachnospiraceae bacterium]